VGGRSIALVSLGLGLTAALGCQQHAYVVALDGGARDGGGDVATSPALTISVTGCATFDVPTATCKGPAPLTVSFAPIGSPELTFFRWTFGDGTPASTEAAPTHTFALPNSSAQPTYDVGVVGSYAKGTVTGMGCHVAVSPLGAGAACDVDEQCGGGLQCLCKLGSGCGPAFTRGICSTSCATGFCGPGAVCATIALGSPADGGAPAPICLADCSGGGACAPGFACQQIPSGGTASAGWVDACLPIGAAKDFGASCRDANGALDDAACTTGHCADIGALGMCSAPCGSGQSCPAGAACAVLAGAATPLCLPACSQAAPCTGDPALRCTPTASGDAGVDGGLAITAGTPGVDYCAPG